MKRMNAGVFNVQRSPIDPSQATAEAAARWNNMRAADMQGYQTDPHAVARQDRLWKTIAAGTALCLAAIGVTVAALAVESNHGTKYDASAAANSSAPESPTATSASPSAKPSASKRAAVVASTSARPSVEPSKTSASPSAVPSAETTMSAPATESPSPSESATANGNCTLDTSSSTLSCGGTIDAYDFASGTKKGNTDLGEVYTATVNACDIVGNEISISAYGGSWAFLPLPGVSQSQLSQLEAACTTDSSSMSVLSSPSSLPSTVLASIG